MDFILENKDFFYKRYTPREPKDGVDALDSVDPAINSRMFITLKICP
jgi:hypothetical protein